MNKCARQSAIWTLSMMSRDLSDLIYLSNKQSQRLIKAVYANVATCKLNAKPMLLKRIMDNFSTNAAAREVSATLTQALTTGSAIKIDASTSGHLRIIEYNQWGVGKLSDSLSEFTSQPVMLASIVLQYLGEPVNDDLFTIFKPFRSKGVSSGIHWLSTFTPLENGFVLLIERELTPI